jgi:hypothetical protein
VSANRRYPGALPCQTDVDKVSDDQDEAASMRAFRPLTAASAALAMLAAMRRASSRARSLAATSDVRPESDIAEERSQVSFVPTADVTLCFS